jgi:hypothetical protein
LRRRSRFGRPSDMRHKKNEGWSVCDWVTSTVTPPLWQQSLPMPARSSYRSVIISDVVRYRYAIKRTGLPR